jgi:putative ABC transport system permease protein
MFDIPLGWLQLKREKLRFAVALLGVSFAVVLILMQLGFREALFKSAVRFHESLDGDIVIISRELPIIVQPYSFSSRRIYQARGVPGVESVTPIYLGLAPWKNPDTHSVRVIFVIGIDPAERVFALEDVHAQRAAITREDDVLFDELSRPEFGLIAPRVRSGTPVEVEVSNRRLRIVGLYGLGTSFGIDGSMVTSETNFLRIFPGRQRGVIEIGLVRVAPANDPERVRDAIRRQLPADVEVLTRAQFVQREIDYWDTATPIGYVFGFGVIVGMVVGGIIVYQILFADVNDHLPEYATLKAMGYSNTFLAGVVIQQAVILAALGFIPAMGLSLVLYRVSGEATRLPLEMTSERAIFVFGLTVAMCTLSALMALRKVRSADPAEIF